MADDDVWIFSIVNGNLTCLQLQKVKNYIKIENLANLQALDGLFEQLQKITFCSHHMECERFAWNPQRQLDSNMFILSICRCSKVADATPSGTVVFDHVCAFSSMKWHIYAILTCAPHASLRTSGDNQTIMPDILAVSIQEMVELNPQNCFADKVSAWRLFLFAWSVCWPCSSYCNHQQHSTSMPVKFVALSFMLETFTRRQKVYAGNWTPVCIHVA